VTDTVVRDLFGEVPKPEPMEVHEHAIISGPRSHHSGAAIVHSHPGGDEPHQHEPADLEGALKKHMTAYWKLHPYKFGPRSIDAPIPGTDGLTLGDVLSNERNVFA
jgi:hypothetical protein